MEIKPTIAAGQVWLRDARRSDIEVWRYKITILAVFDDLDGTRRVVFQPHRHPTPRDNKYRSRKEVKLVTQAYVWTKYTLVSGQ